MKAPDYLSVILSPYSTKSNGLPSVCLPSLPLPHNSHPMRGMQARLAFLRSPSHDFPDPVASVARSTEL